MPTWEILLGLIFCLALGWIFGNCFRRSGQDAATKQDLNQLENNMSLKLSEVKAAIAEAARQSKEAFAELGTKIADMQRKIDGLIANASDPDITDETFLADLESLKADTKALADIVPGEPTPPAEPPTP